jgi:hypothetical protein
MIPHLCISTSPHLTPQTCAAFSPVHPAWVRTEKCVARSKNGVVKLQEQTPRCLRVATKEEMAPIDQ